MSALAPRQNGYMNATRSVGMPRDVEYQLFARVTGQINMALSGEGGFPDLAEALHQNFILWQTIAFDVMDEDNALPPSLRAQLFYLYEFTRVHTQKVLRKEADASALIEVNTSIMRGLRANNGAVEKGSEKCPA